MATDPQDAYDRWAAQYDTDANDTRDLNVKVLRKQTFIEVDNVVLELGCGTGFNTEWLVAQAGPVVATDVSGEMLARARARLASDSVTLQTLDVAEPWPFETVVIDAYVHPVSDFVNAGVAAGFAVREMGEWRADGDEKPRLLTMRFSTVPEAAAS